jgi:putative 4-mercaptohistidine N1-methyltranferase
MNIYETPRLLGEYLLFHYASAEEILPWDFGPRDALNFPVRSVTRLLDPALLASLDHPARALDLGCAVGRSSYELAVFCPDVLGMDYSQSFVDAAETIRQHGSHAYQRSDEGSHRTPLFAQRPATGNPQHLRFQQGDAMDLPPGLGGFDVVHAANLLCRLTEPARLLHRFPSLVRPGGQLLLTTPCTWLEEYTPPAHWPPGSTLDWLRAALDEHFTLDHEENLPFLIREHARKYQWSVAQGTRWIRK